MSQRRTKLRGEHTASPGCPGHFFLSFSVPTGQRYQPAATRGSHFSADVSLGMVKKVTYLGKPLGKTNGRKKEEAAAFLSFNPLVFYGCF